MDGREQILLHYIGGAERQSGDGSVQIEFLCLVGYLRSRYCRGGEMYETTDKGLIYLRAHGHQVDAPDVVNGRMVR